MAGWPGLEAANLPASAFTIESESLLQDERGIGTLPF